MRIFKSLLPTKRFLFVSFSFVFDDINADFPASFIQSNTSVEQVGKVVQRGKRIYSTGAHEIKAETAIF